jgi:hypothetical protein
MSVSSVRSLLGVALTNRTDQEFTQLMKGLQGERLRQAFHYLDENQDGLIRPDQFKRIMLVRCSRAVIQLCDYPDALIRRNLQGTSYLIP